MQTYAVFTTLTPAGRERLREDPDRLKTVRAEVERMGAKINAQWAVMGDYDFVTVVEAPSNEAVAQAAAEISSLGSARLETYPAIEIDRFQKLLKLQPYRTEPHRWQTSFWADAIRRAGRYWTTTRYVKRYARPLTIEGRDNLEGFDRPAVVIANHSSHFDSPTVFAALPPRIRNRLAMAAAADKFYASRKKRTWWYSLFQNAFPVHRGGGARQLEYPLSLLKRGWSILIYPEGGRSRSGQIARFKAGPAIIAMQAKVPVIPIYMEGLRNVMPKGQREPQPAAVTVHVGKPVSLEGVTSVADGTAMLENALRELAGQAPRTAPQPTAEAVPAMATTAGGG